MKLDNDEVYYDRVFSGYSKIGLTKREYALKNKRCAYCNRSFTNKRVKYWCSEYDTDRKCVSLFDSEYYIYWGKFRHLTLERDKGKCVLCKKLAIDVHHIRPISKGGKTFDLDNLISLCYNCHKLKHKPNSHQKNIINPEGIIMQLILPQQYFYHKITEFNKGVKN